MHDDERAIRDLVALWMVATKAGDIDTVLSLMADDVLFLTPGNPPMNKAQFAAGMATLQDWEVLGESDIREICIFGDRAYCRSHLIVTMRPRAGKPGNAVTRAGDILSILHKQKDGWVIARDANMLTVAK